MPSEMWERDLTDAKLLLTRIEFDVNASLLELSILPVRWEGVLRAIQTMKATAYTLDNLVKHMERDERNGKYDETDKPQTD